MPERRPAILYVVDGRHFGGGERVFAQLADRLSTSYRVFVAANPGGIFERQIRHTRAVFLAVDLRCRFSLKPILQILGMVRKHRIDILHSQGARADFFCRLAAKLARAPRHVCTIAMPIEGFDVHRWKKKIYLFADKATQRFVARFIVVSEALRKMFVEGRGIEERRVVRIYNGVELERYSPGDPASESSGMRAISDEKMWVGCFGRLVWQKGLEYLIQAIPAVVSKAAPVHFLIVGEGPERDRLETMAAEIGVGDRVTFCGFMEDILPLLSRVSVVAIPSLKEGLPMITLEAMAMAKPIVATQIDGITEQLQHRRSALLVPPGATNALAEAIVSLLRDKPLAAELGQEARRAVEKRFALQDTITATQEVYEALL